MDPNPKSAPNPPLNPPKSASIFGVLITVFIDMLAFGMFISDLQLRGQSVASRMLGIPMDQAGANEQVGFFIGILISAFSLSQLIGAPMLGRLSDRIGRRKVLLCTCALAMVGHLIYAAGNDDFIRTTFGLEGAAGARAAFAIMAVSRIFAGLAAANLGVAFAYVADITAPQDRAKGIGLLGAGLGLGFILGPASGAGILWLSHDNVFWLGAVASALALINFLYILLWLPESRDFASHVERHPFTQEVKIALGTPSLRLLLIMFFVYNAAVVLQQTTFFRLLEDHRGIFGLPTLDAKWTGAIILGLIGLFGAIVQGGLLARLTPRFGEVNLLRTGLIMVIPGLALLPYAHLWLPMIGVVAIQGIGFGLSQPSINSLISRNAPKNIQGGVFGITQSLGAVARLIGPLIANPAFARGVTLPFTIGAVMVLVPLAAAWIVRLEPPAVVPEAPSV